MVEVANLRITLEWFLEIAGTNKMKSFSLNFDLLNEATFPVFSTWLYQKKSCEYSSIAPLGNSLYTELILQMEWAYWRFF